MVKWEYYVLSTLKLEKQLVITGYYLKDGVKIIDEPTHFFDHIQELGNEGWELVIHTIRGKRHDKYILKRKIVSNEISIKDREYGVIKDTEWGMRWFLGKEKQNE